MAIPEQYGARRDFGTLQANLIQWADRHYAYLATLQALSAGFAGATAADVVAMAANLSPPVAISQTVATAIASALSGFAQVPGTPVMTQLTAFADKVRDTGR